ncbi:Glycosyltransferase involved in cell wall bisynthesis [Modestobacter sp. DSM 44400]|uniref:glycosyltransferase family 4 protein n=1 Tax=Modestobacter sp. DSM 44400 TaxID=1550230 RepID=UPI00089C9D0F|nr:glycosyltransferase family 4 protein [Modestobacter sp. DSM 44400]SDX91283.1 Glycosyltransferase involved in cell wall bisynthesis [Modestobacter sp. DSM 44400]
MGAHMLDLVAEYVPVADVSVMFRPTEGGRRLLAEAAALGARTVAIPSPRDPDFGTVVTGFLTSHPADVFHCHVGMGVEDFDGVRLARAAGCAAVVQTQHQPFLLSHPRKRAGWHHAVEQVDRLIAVSEALGRTYERIGAAPGRLTTVPNGVAPRTHQLGRAAARGLLGLGREQPVVLTIGRLAPFKGHRHLIDAIPQVAAQFPEVVVVLVGDGALRGALAKHAAGLGISDRVYFAGHRPDARLLLDAADVFVLPSLHEGMPLVALEAMEAGLPVVGTRVTGTEEVVVDGETGALVPPGNATALATAMAALLRNPDRRRVSGEAGQRRYLERFTRDRMAAATWAVYDEALQAGRSDPCGVQP